MVWLVPSALKSAIYQWRLLDIPKEHAARRALLTILVLFLRLTVIRVLCSQIPLNAEAQQAIAADETAVVFDGDEGVLEVSEAPVIDVEPEPEQEVGADG
jgi:hypothetical protein